MCLNTGSIHFSFTISSIRISVNENNHLTTPLDGLPETRLPKLYLTVCKWLVRSFLIKRVKRKFGCWAMKARISLTVCTSRNWTLLVSGACVEGTFLAEIEWLNATTSTKIQHRCLNIFFFFWIIGVLGTENKKLALRNFRFNVSKSTNSDDRQ